MKCENVLQWPTEESEGNIKGKKRSPLPKAEFQVSMKGENNIHCGRQSEDSIKGEDNLTLSKTELKESIKGENNPPLSKTEFWERMKRQNFRV